jgi:hypothetical protein
MNLTVLEEQARATQARADIAAKRAATAKQQMKLAKAAFKKAKKASKLAKKESRAAAEEAEIALHALSKAHPKKAAAKKQPKKRVVPVATRKHSRRPSTPVAPSAPEPAAAAIATELETDTAPA